MTELGDMKKQSIRDGGNIVRPVMTRQHVTIETDIDGCWILAECDVDGGGVVTIQDYECDPEADEEMKDRLLECVEPLAIEEARA